MVQPEKWHGSGLELGEEVFSYARQSLLPFLSPLTADTPCHTPYFSEFSQSTTELFSFKFDTASALTSHHSQLFDLLKQRIMLARQMQSLPHASSHCQHFLCYLTYSLSALPGRGSELKLFSEAISSQIEAVCLLCGSLSEIFRTSTSCTLPHAPLDISPLSRLLMDTKTHLLLASDLLAAILPELWPRSLQQIRSIWSELLELSLSLFLSQSDLIRLNFTPFPCTSLLVLWSLSAALSERTSDCSGFWTSFLPHLLAFTSDAATSDRLSPSERHQFFWWLLLSLARILPDWIRTTRCWDLCREAVSSLITHTQSTPLLFSLWTLINLSEQWGGCMETVMLLWDGISKKMSDSLHKELSISDVSELRYDIINTPQDVRRPLNLSPFELFLRFFSLQFNLSDLPPSECWKPYKGRFYSKLSTRRLQNISSQSALNLYLLAFVLSYKTDVNDVIDKTSEILLKLSCNTLTPRTRLLIWECLFGLLHVFVERKVCAGSYLSRLLPTLAECHSAAMFDKSCTRRQWEVCRLLWQHLPDLSCCVEQIGAVCEVLKELYPAYYSAFHAEHMDEIVLSLDQMIAGAHTLLVENSFARHASREISCFLWEFGYTHWKEDHLAHAAQEMGSLLGNLVLLSLASESDLRISLSEVVRQVLFPDGLACPTGSKFIIVLLTDGAGRRYISQNQIISQLIIKAWLLYIVQASKYPQFQPPLLACTRELGALSFLEQVNTRSVDSMNEVLGVMDSLFRYLSSQSGTGAQFYFSHFLEWIEPLLCDQNTSKECLFTIYRIASSLVRHGSSLVYSRTQPQCVLPRLIEYLFLPAHSLAKPPHTSHLDCVRRHICSFLISLCRLCPESDQFIQRKIRQLLSQYFPRFSEQSQDTQSCAIFTRRPNPFLSLFNPPDYEEETTLYLLSVIRELFLKLPQQPSSLLPTLQFLQEAAASFSAHFAACASEHLLFPMLGCLLACNVCPADREPPRIRNLSQDVVRKIVTSVASLTDVSANNHRQKLVECIKGFVEVNLSSCHGKVFTTLEFVAQLSPEVISPSMGHFRASLLAQERENPKLAPQMQVELGRLESLLDTNKQLH